jgi:cation transport ATPase
MSNMCEWAVILLQHCVEQIAQQSKLTSQKTVELVLRHLVKPNVQVHWVAVIPWRYLQITSFSRLFATTHAVLLIRSPMAGNFILDPTAE